jgi:hypothetical protein
MMTFCGSSSPPYNCAGSAVSPRRRSTAPVLYLTRRSDSRSFAPGRPSRKPTSPLGRRPETSCAAGESVLLAASRTHAPLLPNESEVPGLLALTELQASPTAGRRGKDDEAVLLPDQDRPLWTTRRFSERNSLAHISRSGIRTSTTTGWLPSGGKARSSC